MDKTDVSPDESTVSRIEIELLTYGRDYEELPDLTEHPNLQVLRLLGITLSAEE